MHRQGGDCEVVWRELVDIVEKNEEDTGIHVDEGGYSSNVGFRRYCRSSFGMEAREGSIRRESIVVCY